MTIILKYAYYILQIFDMELATLTTVGTHLFFSSLFFVLFFGARVKLISIIQILGQIIKVILSYYFVPLASWIAPIGKLSPTNNFSVKRGKKEGGEDSNRKS